MKIANVLAGCFERYFYYKITFIFFILVFFRRNTFLQEGSVLLHLHVVATCHLKPPKYSSTNQNSEVWGRAIVSFHRLNRPFV